MSKVKYAVALKNTKLWNAEKEAEKFINLISPPNPDMDWSNYPALDAITVLYVISKWQAKNQQSIKALLSVIQSKNAKHSRPSRQKLKEKAIVKQYLQEWKNEPALYPNKTEFVNDMVEKTKVERKQTIREWIKVFEVAWSLRHCCVIN